MTGRTHDLAAITALGVVVIAQPEQVVTLSTLIAAVFANQFGSMTPDLDQPTAPFWRALPIGNFIGNIADNLLGGHRFITHSLLGVAGIGFVAHWLLVLFHPLMPSVDIGLVWWAYMIGVLSHLVMDSFTKEGVPWLLPIPIKFGLPPLKRLRLTTGKVVENWLVFPGLLVFNAIFYSIHSQEVLNILHHYIR